MSWQSYIDTQLVNKLNSQNQWEITGCVEHAAIFGAADLSIWASTPGFALGQYNINVPTDDGVNEESCHVNEVDIFRSVVTTRSAGSKAGIRICNEKYFLVNYDEERHTIYLKKNGGGACIVKTLQTYIFASWNGALEHGGVHPGNQNPGLCNERCESLAAYLAGEGF
ncbi:unnamed protein product [Blepharisma stoltei]|uniref:Profilin n=1 Tax=Blepharisma stoltei TaxID=1481888 RepID=A0AAU9II93_9CILI|nr:unnamed protein product [Blepharisma stoltei]